MAFSIWEYLRERTRDAVLAGFQDALDIAEQDDTEGSQHAAARRLGARLAAGSLTHESAQVETPPPAVEAKSLPHPSVNGRPVENGRAASAATPKAPARPANVSLIEDEFESRLNSAAVVNGSETPQAGHQGAPRVQRPKRGRPPKKSQP